MHKVSQEEQIVDFCKVNGFITRARALKIGITQLSSRLCNMRYRGYVIEQEKKNNETRYWIVKTPDEVAKDAYNELLQEQRRMARRS